MLRYVLIPFSLGHLSQAKINSQVTYLGVYDEGKLTYDLD